MTILTILLEAAQLLAAGLCLLKRRRRKIEKQTVRLPALCFWIGLICVFGFALFVLLCLLEKAAGTGLALSLLSLLGLSLVLAETNWRIVYDEEGFDYVTFLGRCCRISYEQVRSQKGRRKDVTLYTDVRRVYLDQDAWEREPFLGQVRKKYRTLHGGMALPTVQQIRWDPFRGNIDNPGEIVAVWVMVTAFLIGIPLFSLLQIRPAAPEELTVLTATVQDAQWRDGQLNLHPAGTDLELFWTPEEGQREQVSELLQAGEPLEMGYLAGSKDRILLQSLRTGRGEVLLTPEQVFAHRWDGLGKVLLILGSIQGLWLAACGVTVYMGRHAERFSRKTLQYFFKPSYILNCAPDKKKKRRK